MHAPCTSDRFKASIFKAKTRSKPVVLETKAKNQGLLFLYQVASGGHSLCCGEK